MIGCGSKVAETERAAETQLELLEKMMGILRKAKDVKEAKPLLEPVFREVQANANVLTELGRSLPREDGTAYLDKYEPKFKYQHERYMYQVKSLAERDPAGAHESYELLN